MKSGAGISEVEVLNVSPRGLWLLLREEEFFLDYERFPWFREATIEQVTTVEMAGSEHVRWPMLDVDLEPACIKRPDDFPLVAKAGG